MLILCFFSCNVHYLLDLFILHLSHWMPWSPFIEHFKKSIFKYSKYAFVFIAVGLLWIFTNNSNIQCYWSSLKSDQPSTIKKRNKRPLRRSSSYLRITMRKKCCCCCLVSLVFIFFRLFVGIIILFTLVIGREATKKKL